MKKLFALPLAAVVALGACADFQGAVAPEDLNIGVSSPGTGVNATFTIGSTESEWQNWPNAPINVPNGHYNTQCDADGRYYRTNQNGTGAQWSDMHNERCGRFVGGNLVQITLTGIVANFVAPPSGNRQLNFTVCGYVEVYDETTEEMEWVENCDSETFIHHKKSSNETYGAGAVLGVDGDGNEWIVILSSVGHQGRSQFDVRTFTGVTAERLDGSISTTSAELTF